MARRTPAEGVVSIKLWGAITHGGDDARVGADAHKAGVAQTQLTEDTHGEVQGYGHGHIAADGDQQAGHGAVQDSGTAEQCDGHIEDHNTEIGGEIHGIGPTEFLKFHSGHLTLSPSGFTSSTTIKTANTMEFASCVEI